MIPKGREGEGNEGMKGWRDEGIILCIRIKVEGIYCVYLK